MIRILIVIALLLSVLAFATPTSARTPKQFVTRLIEQVETIQNVGERDVSLLDVVKYHFDTRRMGKFVLSRYWKKATLDQQERFIEFFELVSIQRFSPLLKDIPFDISIDQLTSKVKIGCIPLFLQRSGKTRQF